MTHLRSGIRRARRYGLAIILGAVSIGTVSNQVRINAQNAKFQQQARAGQRARVTQCHTFPVAVKLYTAAQRYGLITPRDLATYLAAAPQGCPPTRR